MKSGILKTGQAYLAAVPLVCSPILYVGMSVSSTNLERAGYIGLGIVYVGVELFAYFGINKLDQIVNEKLKSMGLEERGGLIRYRSEMQELSDVLNKS